MCHERAPNESTFSFVKCDLVKLINDIVRPAAEGLARRAIIIKTILWTLKVIRPAFLNRVSMATRSIPAGGSALRLREPGRLGSAQPGVVLQIAAGLAESGSRFVCPFCKHTECRAQLFTLPNPARGLRFSAPTAISCIDNFGRVSVVRAAPPWWTSCGEKVLQLMCWGKEPWRKFKKKQKKHTHTLYKSSKLYITNNYI